LVIATVAVTVAAVRDTTDARGIWVVFCVVRAGTCQRSRAAAAADASGPAHPLGASVITCRHVVAAKNSASAARNDRRTS